MCKAKSNIDGLFCFFLCLVFSPIFPSVQTAVHLSVSHFGILEIVWRGWREGAGGLLGGQMVVLGQPGRPGRSCWEEELGRDDGGMLLGEQLLVEVGGGGVVEGGVRAVAPAEGHCGRRHRRSSRGVLGRNSVSFLKK